MLDSVVIEKLDSYCTYFNSVSS